MLLSVTFAETDSPAGKVTLIFSGGAAIRLMSSAWRRKCRISARVGRARPARRMILKKSRKSRRAEGCRAAVAEKPFRTFRRDALG